MTARVELTDHIGRDARLNVKQARQEFVIVERTDVMLGIKARSFDSFLRIHAELDNIKQHLQQALILIVTARRAQDHEWLAIFEHQRRSQGNAWTLARRDD